MTTQRIRHYGVVTATGEQPDNDTTRNILKALVGILLIIGVIVCLRWLGEYNTAQTSADPPVVEAPVLKIAAIPTVIISSPRATTRPVSAETVVLYATNSALSVEFSLSPAGNSYMLTDKKGYSFICGEVPLDLSEMETCEFIGKR